MALDKDTLKAGIKQLHDDMITRNVESNEEYATRLSDLIDAFVKSGEGKITAGAMVAGSTPVTGTATVIVKFD